MPTIFDTYYKTLNVEKVSRELKIFDQGGAAENKGFRLACYKDTDCFVVCFALDDK